MTENDRPIMCPILWNAETEVCLFYAMRGHKPVGINKHFHMMGIHSKFAQSLGQPVTSAQLWEHLSSMYNLTVLDESDSLPFSNNVKHFQLPDEILNFGKDRDSGKETEVPEREKTSASTKSSSNKDLQTQSKHTPTSAKSNRKRTRNIPAASPATGAAGPGSNKRRRW